MSIFRDAGLYVRSLAARIASAGERERAHQLDQLLARLTAETEQILRQLPDDGQAHKR